MSKTATRRSEDNADDGLLVALLERKKNKLNAEISEMKATAASAAKG